MFSGLTNQVSSWMGAAKGEPQDEEVPTPTKEAIAEAAAAEAEKQSPTKGGSKLDLITNVKSQMTGWLGSGIPIPGLRKNEPAPAEQPEQPPTTETAEIAEPKAEGKDDDDNSSATGGADSRPASTGGTPTEEQPGGVGNGDEHKKFFNVDALEVPDMRELTTKAVAGAKSLGNFLYSAVNKAGAKVSETTAKIKKTVEENVSTLE
ncbi:unnamed protein product [Arctia plantaginis]|uniref:Synapse-associated protein of 47 kDa n=1 Tax=Arctia plantaginis TaxID=874455 RepID=A0A8S0ZIL9_ARCPL|nr:unnamed protein product [Arctia plantaginis]CAB3233023.1 unnamed protein product [Arctia plantaginis]